MDVNTRLALLRAARKRIAPVLSRAERSMMPQDSSAVVFADELMRIVIEADEAAQTVTIAAPAFPKVRKPGDPVSTN